MKYCFFLITSIIYSMDFKKYLLKKNVFIDPSIIIMLYKNSVIVVW